jgi:phage-related protein
VPKTKVVFYREADGRVPVLDWFDGLSVKAQDKCRVKIQRLAELGHELRRPQADFLRDGIYELRIGLHHVNYRILYFLHGRMAAILAHALTKQDQIPIAAIETAIQRKQKYTQDLRVHTFEEA